MVGHNFNVVKVNRVSELLKRIYVQAERRAELVQAMLRRRHQSRKSELFHFCFDFSQKTNNFVFVIIKYNNFRKLFNDC